MAESSQKLAKPRSRRVGAISLDKIQNQLTTILKREIGRLMDLSYEGALTEANSKTLITYLKLIQDLRAKEFGRIPTNLPAKIAATSESTEQESEEDLDQMSDEELKKIQTGG